jgi:uncharacterized protein (TIGR02444 family)
MPEELRTPLWDFAVTTYGGEGVAQECLALQERHGVDVNLLLFGAYAGAVEGVLLMGDDLAAAAEIVGRWHEDVVRKLRAARQALKAWSAGEEIVGLAAGGVREQVKAMELAAEQIELFMLWTWLRERSAGLGRGDKDMALTANLRAVLARYGAADANADIGRLAARLLHAARSGSMTASSARSMRQE